MFQKTLILPLDNHLNNREHFRLFDDNMLTIYPIKTHLVTITKFISPCYLFHVCFNILISKALILKNHPVNVSSFAYRGYIIGWCSSTIYFKETQIIALTHDNYNLFCGC